MDSRRPHETNLLGDSNCLHSKADLSVNIEQEGCLELNINGRERTTYGKLLFPIIDSNCRPSHTTEVLINNDTSQCKNIYSLVVFNLMKNICNRDLNKILIVKDKSG